VSLNSFGLATRTTSEDFTSPASACYWVIVRKLLLVVSNRFLNLSDVPLHTLAAGPCGSGAVSASQRVMGSVKIIEHIVVGSTVETVRGHLIPLEITRRPLRRGAWPVPEDCVLFVWTIGFFIVDGSCNQLGIRPELQSTRCMFKMKQPTSAYTHKSHASFRFRVSLTQPFFGSLVSTDSSS